MALIKTILGSPWGPCWALLLVWLVEGLPNVRVDISLLVVVVGSVVVEVVVVVIVVVEGGGGKVELVASLVAVLVVFSVMFLVVVTIVVATENSIGIFDSQFIFYHSNLI